MSTYHRTKDEIEAMLDGGHTINDLLNMLADICWEKAEWVKSPESVGLPDEKMAKVWEHDAKLCRKASQESRANF